MMGTADQQIRISVSVKRELEHRQREGESFNDVLERLLAGDRDLFAGFGAFEDNRGETVQRIHEREQAASTARVEEIARSRDEE